MYNPNDVFQKQLSQLAESYRQGTPPVLSQMGQPAVEQVKSVPGITGAREAHSDGLWPIRLRPQPSQPQAKH